MLAQHFSSFNPFRSTLSLVRGTNRQFYCTGVIIYNKTRKFFFVSADRQTFWGFEMISNSLDTSPLTRALISYNKVVEYFRLSIVK